jgi:adenylate cyclase
MFTDIVGYTALMQSDESATVRLLEDNRRLVRPIFASHGGREIKTIGDAFLVEFSSALDAVLCSLAIQQMMHNRKVARGETLSLRIGIHVGDVIENGNDIIGDAVNIASRIEPLAEPGGICVSGQAYDQVRNKSELPFVPLGAKSLKNVSAPVEVYAMQMPWEQAAQQKEAARLPRERIAILPFVSFSSNPDDAYFADGMTDEIISAVAGISGLSVISRTSVIGYKGTTKKVKEIGRELEVGSVLEGTFKKAGNRIRVTTQLIDVAEDKHLWAQSYDRNLDDVFEVQSDVAKQVADVLRVKILSPEKERIEKRPTESTSAYTLYLKGRHLWNTRTLDDLKKAREYFEQAVKEDSSFALGYAGQADCCTLLRSNYRIDAEANLARAKALASKALELDSDLAEAHTAMAFNLADERNFQQAEEEFRKAIELKPSYATARQWYSGLLERLLRWDEALGQIEKAEELDPLSPIMAVNHSSCLLIMGRAQEALRVLESAERVNPRGIIILVNKALLSLYLGNTNGARSCLESASAIDPENMSLLDIQGHYEQVLGNHSKALECWERAMKQGRGEGGEVRGFYADFASDYWLTGDKKRALDCIKEIEAMPEENYEARAYKLSILAFAYAGTANSEDFFPAAARMIEEKQAIFNVLRMLRLLYPASEVFLDDPRWSSLFRNAGLEP